MQKFQQKKMSRKLVSKMLSCVVRQYSERYFVKPIIIIITMIGNESENIRRVLQNYNNMF